MKLFNTLTEDCHIERHPTSNGHDLRWASMLGFGFLPSRGYDYGDEYWHKYSVEYAESAISFKLNQFRRRFVLESLGGAGGLCDIGIGAGQFVEIMNCKGYDVNPHARTWLERHEAYGDPYVTCFTTLTFWDVLEHIEDPSPLLSQAKNVFVSLPIHEDVEACLASKHLKPDEHIWQFTERGLKCFMRYFGFELVKSDDSETKIGREDIMAYFFTR